MSQEKGRLIQNKYEIVSKIKQGGFGIVFYGYDHVFEKPIAIKAIEPSLLREAKYIDLFLEEAKNAGKLSHNNIVHIYNLVRDDDGQFFIIMEHINGVDLGKLIRQCRQKGMLIPQELSIFIIKEICKALEYAHNKRDLITDKPLKLVHLDISPSNIMVSFSGQVKLIDFGLAKIRFQNNGQSEQVLSGKLPYMAPEQLNGGEIDRRTDIFSLGVLFYEMMTGSRVFSMDNPEETVELIKRAKIDTTLLAKNNIPETIQRILLKMTQRNPDERYHGANGVYLDLVECLMTTAHSVELSEELGDFIRTLFESQTSVTTQEISDTSAEAISAVEREIDQLSDELKKLETENEFNDELPPSKILAEEDSELIESAEPFQKLGSEIEPDDAKDEFEEANFSSESESLTSATEVEGFVETENAEQTGNNIENYVTPDASFTEEVDEFVETEVAEDTTLLDENQIAETESTSSVSKETIVTESPDETFDLEKQASDSTTELKKIESSLNANLQTEAQLISQRKATKTELVQPVYSEDEGEDDLKTVIDVIRLSTKRHKKMLTNAGIGLAAFLVLFLIVDIFLQITALGEGIYNRLFPPAIKLTTAPSGAMVLLDNKPLSGKTPLSIPRITPGIHALTLTYAGYSPLVKSIQVPSKGEVKVVGETVRKGYDPYLFRFKAQIEITSDPPGAVVFINSNQYLHRTPTTIEWEVGEPLTIEMEQEGFQKLSGFSLNTLEGIEEIEDRRLWTFNSMEAESKRYLVEGKFRKFVTVTSIPSGVTFYIDGSPNPSGRTDVSSTIALNMGKHEIIFKKDGFNAQRVTLNIGKDGPESVSIILTRNVRFFATDKTDLGNNDIGATIAKIIQNNKQYIRNDKTPCEISIPPINLEVVLTKKGYKDATVTVTPRDKDIVVKMEPATIDVEVVVNDALTGLPLKDVQISYRSLSQEQTSEIYYGSTDEKGRCINKVSPGEYSFKVKKFGYFEKFSLINTQSGENKLEFKLIIQ